MTRASCPDCGYDLNVGSLKEGDQTTTTCDNCSSELLIAINEGEIRAQNLREHAYAQEGINLEEDLDY